MERGTMVRAGDEDGARSQKQIEINSVGDMEMPEDFQHSDDRETVEMKAIPVETVNTPLRPQLDPRGETGTLQVGGVGQDPVVQILGRQITRGSLRLRNYGNVSIGILFTKQGTFSMSYVLPAGVSETIPTHDAVYATVLDTSGSNPGLLAWAATYADG